MKLDSLTRQKDSNDIEPMVDMALQLVDYHWDKDLLLGQSFDVLIVDTTVAIS